MWVPSSRDELENAVREQSIAETFQLDCKQFPSMSNSGNKELAKDIAALSIEGGVIILGVEENQAQGSFSLSPQLLAGWKERMSQIGLNRVQPSVQVSCQQLEVEPGRGYLVVRIPVSARAPHMVDGRYYGRSDTTNYQLSDVEVRALIARTQERRRSIKELVSREIAREPEPSAELARHSRLFAVAQPVSANDTLLLDAAPGRDLMMLLRQSFAARPALRKAASYTPTFGHLDSEYRRANGVALSSFHVTSARTSTASSRNDLMSMIDLEVREDGGIRLFYGRASDTDIGKPQQHILVVDAIIGVTSRVIELARDISEIANFTGSWQFGIGLANLRGTQSPESARNIPQRQTLYDEDSYMASVETDQLQLNSPGSHVLEALTGRFLRTVREGSLRVSEYDEFPIRE